LNAAPAAEPADGEAFALHVFWGHARRRDKSRPRCEGSKAMSARHVARPAEHARTYFGMVLCEGCWDDGWRAEGSEGMVDPSFGEIMHKHAGEWLS